MLGAGIEMQSLHLLAAKRAARNHALHGLFQDALGKAAIQHLVGCHGLDPAGIAGVLVIGLLLQLVAGQADLVGIDDHDMVTAIDMRGEARLMLAAQDIGDDHREAAYHQAVGIDQVPLLFHLGRLDRPGGLAERLHGLSIPRICERPCAAGRRIWPRSARICSRMR